MMNIRGDNPHEQEARVMNERELMPCACYQVTGGGKKGLVCKACGCICEGGTLPGGFACPLRQHGAAVFEPVA